MNYLLDTNAISERAKPQPDSRLLMELQRIGSTSLYMSVVTIGEVLKGVLRLAPGRRREALELWVAETEHDFRDRLLAVDRETSRLWAEVEVRRSRLGRPISTADALIAATALRHGMTLITRNTPDFDHTGVTLLNPWT